MHRVIVIIWLASLTIALGLPLGRTLPAPRQFLDQKTFDIASDPDFNDYKQVVMEFARKHRPAAENNFCIVGSLTDNVKTAWVLWREGGQIMLWEGGSHLDRSRRIIRLKSDVVPTEADLHGSTYLVTKAWVNDLSQSCDRWGIKVRTPKTRSSRK